MTNRRRSVGGKDKMGDVVISDKIKEILKMSASYNPKDGLPYCYENGIGIMPKKMNIEKLPEYYTQPDQLVPDHIENEKTWLSAMLSAGKQNDAAGAMKDDGFKGRLPFRSQLVEITPKPDRVHKLFKDAIAAVQSDQEPESGSECDVCRWDSEAAEAGKIGHTH